MALFGLLTVASGVLVLGLGRDLSGLLGVPGGSTYAIAGILVGVVELIVAVGLRRLRWWAYWAGLAALAGHAVAGLLTNLLVTIVAVPVWLILVFHRPIFDQDS